MRKHWQRKPLLVRGAFPAIRRSALAARGARARRPIDDAHLAPRRSAAASAGRSSTARSPRAASSNFRRRDWTVLVQDTNHFSRAADALLARFDFIPHARIDDVMVSYAVPGGGVGPARGFLRRLPAAGPRPPALADLAPARPRVRARPAAEDPRALRARRPSGCSSRATCSTFLRAWRITAWPKPNASPGPSDSARRADAELVAGFLDFLRDRSSPRRALSRSRGTGRHGTRERSRRGCHAHASRRCAPSAGRGATCADSPGASFRSPRRTCSSRRRRARFRAGAVRSRARRGARPRRSILARASPFLARCSS